MHRVFAKSNVAKVKWALHWALTGFEVEPSNGIGHPDSAGQAAASWAILWLDILGARVLKVPQLLRGNASFPTLVTGFIWKLTFHTHPATRARAHTHGQVSVSGIEGLEPYVALCIVAVLSTQRSVERESAISFVYIVHWYWRYECRSIEGDVEGRRVHLNWPNIRE